MVQLLFADEHIFNVADGEGGDDHVEELEMVDGLVVAEEFVKHADEELEVVGLLAEVCLEVGE